MSTIYGVHFGLNAIGFSLSKPIAPLRHAENDARAYHEIISKQGGKSKLFLSSEATVEKFLEELINLSKTCSPNDLIVVTFSGHGTRVKDLNNDEEDGYDEVLVFYDRLLIDDLVKVQFSRFQEGVNIFFITDCCHSGTISKLLNFENEMFADYIERGFSAEIGQEIFNSNVEYRLVKQSINEEALSLKSSIVHLGACQDDETASDGSVIMKHGLFTHRLLKSWEDGLFEGNYNDFFEKIKNQMGGSQNPKINFEGKISNIFIDSKPFTKIHNA